MMSLTPGARGQESTVYAVVVATKLFVVGAANPPTGLFYQHPGEDTSWHHSGPSSTRAFGCAVDPQSGGRVKYIAAGNGLHRTTDGGGHWKITTGWDVTEVQCVAPDPRDEDIVYVATPYGIFRSTDACESWAKMNAGLKSTFTTCVIVDHADSRTLYCATEDGAYCSHDAARSWSRMGLSVQHVRVIAQHPRNPKFLIVGTEADGLYVSMNGGAWWTKSEAGVDHSTFYVVVFDPSNPDVMYAGGYITGVYKSIDGAQSWHRMNNGLGCITIHSMAVDPRNSRCVYAGAYWGGVFRSDDGGVLWRNVGLHDSQVWTIMIQPN
jgi:photosystem II stability/assembly factor-like uncharacterized protein